jgi:ATP phosphoribosyltransferase
MLSDHELRIAVPSKGRLRDRSLELLERAGVRVRMEGRRLHAKCPETGAYVIFSNAQDIPVLVAGHVVDIGITGSDNIEEKDVDVVTHRELGFGRCRLSIAVHRDTPYRSAADLAGKRVGTKFVRLARRHFETAGASDVELFEIQGATEVMVMLGLVDGIVDLVETGSSLEENDLREIEKILDAEAVLIGNRAPRDADLQERLLRRIDGVLHAARYSLLEYNCPVESVEQAKRITPGFSSPTVQELADPRWCSVKVLVEKVEVHRVMDELEKLGCQAILESELRHTRL